MDQLVLDVDCCTGGWREGRRRGDEEEGAGKRMRRREGDEEGGRGEGRREGKERKKEDEGKMEEEQGRRRKGKGEGKEKGKGGREQCSNTYMHTTENNVTLIALIGLRQLQKL